jgi:ABC-type branched-subunit amino acid transport system ATPase component
MYKSCKLENFRGFEKLKINKLARINLVIGKNNVGKTALLEALWIIGAPYNPRLTIQVDNFRGIGEFGTLSIAFGPNVDSPWASLFRNFDLSKEISMTTYSKEGANKKDLESSSVFRAPVPYVLPITRSTKDTQESLPSTTEFQNQDAYKLSLIHTVKDKKPKEYSITMDAHELKVEPNPPLAPYETIFIGALRHTGIKEDALRFGKLQVKREEESLSEVLRLLEPRLKKITTIITPAGPLLHGDIGADKLIPLPIMGEGIARLASIILAMSSIENGVLLIDEIENGFHYSVMEDVWKAITAAASDLNIQVIATTHSLECIRAAHNALAEVKRKNTYDFLLHRLDRDNGFVRVVTYEKETLEAAIESNLEVR